MKEKTILAIYQHLSECKITDESQQKSLGEFCDIQAELEKLIPESTHALLNRLLDKSGEINLQSEEDAFINGFKLGMRIAIESLAD